MIQDPIIIAAPARSGTTMVAGLLIKHGVWVGKCKVTRFTKTNSLIGTENIGAKKLMKRLAKEIGYKNRELPLPEAYDIEPVAQILDSFYRMRVPAEQKWLAKTTWTLIFSKVWMKAFPNAKWIFIDRDVKDILSSVQNHPQMLKRDMEQMLRFIRALKERQKELMMGLPESNYIFLNVDAIASKQEDELERLFDFCEVEMDMDIVNEFINPAMWHGKNQIKC